jgi:hypothetical protein
VATIRVDAKEHVWVNGKKVKAKRSDGALVFKDGSLTYTIQGNRRLKGEDTWLDSDAGTKGLSSPSKVRQRWKACADACGACLKECQNLAA